MAAKQSVTPGRKPTHRIYRVIGEGEASSWTPIGAAWPNRDGLGFSISCDAVPLTGRIVMRAITAQDSTGVRNDPHYQTLIIRWQGIEIEVRYAPDCFCGTIAHLELRSIPKRTPLPVTETGYKSYFHPQGIVEDVGGPEAFARAWLDHHARKPGWRLRADQARQMSLF